MMFGMGMTEIMLIMGIILVVLGPEKIPDVAKLIGKTMREVRKASNLLRDAVMIDDKPKSRKQKQPAFDQALDSPEIEIEKTKNKIIVVNMPDRLKPTDIEEISFAAFIDPTFRPTEVYLHTPYTETF
jgi:TatA/E family protein of Tat protein translocase